MSFQDREERGEMEQPERPPSPTDSICINESDSEPDQHSDTDADVSIEI